ncbi:transporter [Halococcus qingdaonensis]|nr:transporter [Halococcus qingdaonensis]
MVARSTWLILAGVILLFLPMPPILSAVAGVGVIIAGVALRFVGDDDN